LRSAPVEVHVDAVLVLRCIVGKPITPENVCTVCGLKWT
jgi:hypothetical protein